MTMRQRMAKLGQRIIERREQLGLRQLDIAEKAVEIDPETSIDIFYVGGLERGRRSTMIPPEDVLLIEQILGWKPRTILGICGYLDEVNATAPSSADVITTLMDAEDLTTPDKDLVRNMVREMARRSTGT